MKKLALLLVAAGLLTGCGSKDTVSPDPVADAATKTAAAKTNYMAVRATTKVPGIAKPIALTGEGAFDNERMLGWMTLDMSAFAEQLPEAEADGVKAADLKMKQIIDFSDGLVIYMQFPDLLEAFGSDKQWVRVDVGKAGRELGVDIDTFMQLGQNPADQLGPLRTVSEDLEEVGKETVRGVEATHYRGTVDLRKYPELVPEEDRAKVRKTVEQMIAIIGSPTYPVDVWVDDDELVRRMSFDMNTKEPEGTMQMAMTIELFDFGRPVDVEVPDAADTIDISELGEAG
jgi:hypothetical protein